MKIDEKIIKIDEIGKQMFHQISFEKDTVKGSYDEEDYLSHCKIYLTIEQADFILDILKELYKNKTYVIQND